MPTISKIRFANVIYEQGSKRYHDETFRLDTQNGVILLENGGGKTVFIQAVMQAIIPHANVADRQIKDTLYLEEGPAHIAIEWLLNERPRQYLVTAVTVFTRNNKVETLRYVYEYSERDKYSLDNLPFTKREAGVQYPASKDDMHTYYQATVQQSPMRAKLFPQSIKAFTDYLEMNYSIMREEWENMIRMNSTEGGIEKVFEECKSTQELFDRLLIPSVENADKHFNPLSMSEQFERQRSNLKKYKEFSEKIIEYKAMEQQIDRYVERFRVYHEASKGYEDDKHFAAAFYHYLIEQKESILTEVKRVDAELVRLDEQQQELMKQQAANVIYKKQEEMQALKRALAALQEQLDAITIQFQIVQHAKYSLDYANYRERVKRAEELIRQAEEELANEHEKEDLDDLQNQLEWLKGQWLFLLESEKEQIEQQQQQKKQVITEIDKQKIELQHKVQALQKELDKTKEDTAYWKAKMDTSTGNLRTLKNELVSNENEQVEQLLKGWNERVVELEYSYREYEDRLKMLKQQLMQFATQLEEKKNHEQTLEKTILKLQMQQQSYDEESAHMKENVRSVLPKMAITATIYDRATSYTNQLQEKNVLLEKQRNEKLAEERKANRYLDDYGLQTQFFADPYIAEQIQHWSQFTTLQTGVQYVESLGEHIERDKITYPFWAITLITTTEQEQTLRDKIHVSSDRLTTPIIVLTREKARALVQGEAFDDVWIAPAFWQQQADPTLFAQWKSNAKMEAKRIETERIILETRLKMTEQVLQGLLGFLQKYPYETYKELIHDLEQTEQEQRQINREIQSLKRCLEDHQQEFANYERQLKDVTEELRYLQENRIPKAMDYQKTQNQLISQQQQLDVLEVQVNKQKQETKQCLVQKDELDLQWQHEKSEQVQLQLTLDIKILKHPIYVEKVNLTAQPTTENDYALELAVKRVEQSINQTSATVQQLQERIRTSKERLAENANSLERLLAEFPQLDTDVPLPAQADVQLLQLQQEQQRLEEKKQEQGQIVLREKTTLTTLEAHIQLLTQQFSGPLPQLTMTLEERERVLAASLQKHSQVLVFTKSERTRLSTQANALEHAERTMQTYYFEHQLNKIKTPEKQLSSEQRTAFLYDYSKEIKRISASLAELNKAKQLEVQKIDDEKKRFRTFCADLRDQKMRQVAVDGIENRKTYKEVIEHQQLLHKSINQSVHLAEVAIQGYDKDQQQIIQYAVQQLQRVRNGLLEIPKKTRIRTADESKYIYQFMIPEWEEHVAKEAIREHIEWILTTLEQDKFKDEYGNEDIAAVRKFLEKHLQTVPLLRQVLGNKTMQVKCRKVESERQISSHFYGWEQSNQWSGGERWSKNMALYLGILKFIAEKSGRKSNTKRERTLMLDNPFGKASSDHVLSPVFYIAEQLGFQIIALTAHAEGKYIADYFPVVYSCRLRSVRDESHQVIQKEQTLNKAFFADQIPEVLHYIGEKQQLSLFGAD